VYKIRATNKFEKDFAKCAKRNYDLDLLGKALEVLENS
jgi:mRNA-degrading endonuclease YafQ of YafQ-DinJ toxin-antitoxin module